MRLNRKGFTLVEVLACIVILAVIIAIMVPSVNTLIKRSREDSYEDLQLTLLQSAKMYLSDNRYEVSIEGSCSSENDDSKIIKTINDIEINGKLYVGMLVNAGDVKIGKDGKIRDPRDGSQYLNFDSSYVKVVYDCRKKDFDYSIVSGTSDDSLKWIKE